jgi:hypothetical protein
LGGRIAGALAMGREKALDKNPYRERIKKLVADGAEIANDLSGVQGEGKKIFNQYQRWYSEAIPVVKQLLPHRFVEFKGLYEDGSTEEVANLSIRQFLLGQHLTGYAMNPLAGVFVPNPRGYIFRRLRAQVQIVESCRLHFDSGFMNLENVVRADLFESELDASRELLRLGFLRPAGVVPGVILEKHLKQVCDFHQIEVKPEPSLSDLYDALYKENVITKVEHKTLERLAIIRNYCDHLKEREPTKEEVDDLLDSVENYVKAGWLLS